jgi:hypothetical protein
MAGRPGRDDVSRAARINLSSQEEFFSSCWPWLLHILLSQASDSGLAEEAAAETITTVSITGMIWSPSNVPIPGCTR